MLQNTTVPFKDDKDEVVLNDGTMLKRNLQGERIGIYFDEKGHFAGFVGQITVKEYGGKPLEKPIVSNKTSKGESIYYDIKGKLLMHGVRS